MKNGRDLVNNLFILIVVIMLFGFVREPTEQYVASNIEHYYLAQMKKFEASIVSLEVLLHSESSDKIVKEAFLECREAYKRNEFILGYLDQAKYKKFNGANLVTSPFQVVSKKELVYPHGLQVMEELIYQPSETSREILLEEIQLLKDLTSQEITRLSQHSAADASQFNIFILDALKIEVYRIEALGLTGFDTPNSLNGIPEAIASLESIRAIVHFYKPLMIEKNIKSLHQDGDDLIEAAINYLENHQDFDQLNRLDFYDLYLHPLSAYFNRMTESLNYNFPTNVDAVNRKADHLFAENSLNSMYFNTKASSESIALGKKLFHNPIFSSDNKRSCATCHNPQLAFSDGMTKNFSIDQSETLLRNTPSLLNVGYQTSFFYDMRAGTLESQSLEVIFNKLEMGGDIEVIMDYLLMDPVYTNLLDKEANLKLNTAKLTIALADYISSLTSTNSKLDEYFAGDQTALNKSEKNGFNIFAGKAKCATCHFFPMFNGLVPPKYAETEAEIIGVPATAENQSIIDKDNGRMSVSGLDIHQFSFKTPTLRNVELTAPYMHNGVFESLEEVVEFYNNGGGAGQGMELPSQTLSSDSLYLSEQEKVDLVNFMKALTSQDLRY